MFPHVFGTDRYGRDIMVRTMFATRVSMIIGLTAALIVLVIGALYGSISGFFGGTVDVVMQRIVDVIYSLPDVLIILLIATAMAPMSPSSSPTTRASSWRSSLRRWAPT